MAQYPPEGQGLHIHEDSRSHSDTPHSHSGRVITSSQGPLPDNIQHSQQIDIHAPVGFKPTIPAGERSQTYTLDPVATGTGNNDE